MSKKTEVEKGSVAVELTEVEMLKKEIEELRGKLKVKSGGRKEELLGILKAGRISDDDAAEKMGITTRNVQTLKSYLKADGWNFGKDSKGRVYIEEDEEVSGN